MYGHIWDTQTGKHLAFVAHSGDLHVAERKIGTVRREDGRLKIYDLDDRFTGNYLDGLTYEAGGLVRASVPAAFRKLLD